MKTLVIAAHPALKDSVINKRWLSELQKYPDQYTIHVLADVSIRTAALMRHASSIWLRRTAA